MGGFGVSVFKIGEKDRTGRQKRIEHTGKYLRATGRAVSHCVLRGVSVRST